MTHDADRQYEMVDPIRFSLPSKELGYDNPVAFFQANIKHTYETPSHVAGADDNRKPRMRAKVNDVYERSDEDLNQTKIFEAIRKIDCGSADEKKKKQCQLGCFSVFSLVLLSLLSLTSSGYIFYKMEIEQSLRRCTCDDKVQAFPLGGSNKNKTEKVNSVPLSDQLQQLEKKIMILEKRLNQTTEQTKINNSLNSRNYLDDSLQEIQNVLDKKILAFSKNVTWMKGLLSETTALVETVENLEMELNRMNNTFNSEVAKLKTKLAGKGSFRNCTFNMKKKTNIFSQTDFDYISLKEKKFAKHKIVGVTCASTMAGNVQYSQLAIEKKDGNIIYKCECTQRSITKSNSQLCIMYFWQCPNT